MSKEATVYRYFFVDSGVPRAKKERIDFDSEQERSVLFCTFPGVEKHFVKDTASSGSKVVLKASAELKPVVQEGTEKGETGQISPAEENH